MTTRHTSLATADVGVVDGHEFRGSALLAVLLPLRRLLERPVPLRVDEIAVSISRRDTTPQRGVSPLSLSQWAAHCKRIQACERLLVDVTLAFPWRAASCDVVLTAFTKLASVEQHRPPREDDRIGHQNDEPPRGQPDTKCGEIMWLPLSVSQLLQPFVRACLNFSPR